MPRCKNCKKPFDAYTMERGALPVINMQPFDVVKFFCPHCMSLQHLLSAPPQHVPENSMQTAQFG